MLLLIKLFLLFLKINLLQTAKPIFTHRLFYNDRIAQNLYLLAYESYFQDAGRCIPKNLEGFETFAFYTNKVLICDKFRNKCGFYVLVSRREKIIIIAFSGSISPTQAMLQTLSSFRKRVFYKKLGLVSQYYANSFDILWRYVRRVFYEPLYRNFKVYITGHSLGGVHASLAAINIQLSKLRKSEDIFLYTFGEPRFGSYEFAVNFDKRIPNSWRVVVGSDIVPHFPPCKKMKEKNLKFYKRIFDKSKPCDPYDHNGYYHHAVEVWYPAGTNGKYYICNGKPKNEDFGCSDGLLFRKRNVRQHRYNHSEYFKDLTDQYFYMFYYKADRNCKILKGPKNRRPLVHK